jgi:hypothetical protein
MLAFVLGVFVLILLLFAAYSFSKADAKQAARRADGINQANAAVGVRLRSAITEALGILVAITADKTRKTAA